MHCLVRIAAGGSVRVRGESGDVNASGATRDAFNAALENWLNRTAERAPVVPIDQLFYEDGAGGLIQATSNPPTSSAERLRLELVSLGEHLRQVLDDARHVLVLEDWLAREVDDLR